MHLTDIGIHKPFAMKYFLQQVAEDLYRRYGNDLSHTAVIFPNKRASLFLNEYLAECSEKPIWAPRYLTISDFFLSLSDKVVADHIETVCRLYNHYVRRTASKETLDYFFGWGERLLADFDDVDKNMADAPTLFRDLRDYAGVEQYDLLDEEQAAQLQRFSSDFARDKLTHVQSRFNTLWQAMNGLYDDLRTDLASDGKAYEGQLYREVVENLKAGCTQLPADIEHVAVVGFNVIDRVEQTLFEILNEKQLALFYWDYDTYYAAPDGSKHNEAGLFMQANLKRFANALPEEAFSNFLKARSERVIEFASAQTELAQAQSVERWLSDPHNFDPAAGKRTAIVLCNEELLQPVLHALPQNAKDTNVTKGFPLSHTPAYTCVTDYIAHVQQEHDRSASKAKGGNHVAWPENEACLPALQVLQNEIQDNYKKVLNLSAADDMLHDLYVEAYFQVYTAITRFATLVSDGLLRVQLPTLLKLLRQVLHSVSIPFHGEPLKGLQIMGVLETRCLDFDNVLMLSVGEGILPQRTSEASFIPYLLRKMHALTTPDRQISVYAYYFYRLLQRAKRVRLCYNTSTDGTHRGEMSRFMRALLAEASADLGIRHLSLRAAFSPLPPLKPAVGKEHSDFLDRVQRKGVSPSALKAYFKCPLMFYYQYIKRLKTPQEQDGIINANDFGTIFHKAAENIYQREFEAGVRPITPAIIGRFLKEGGQAMLSRMVDEAFREVNEERAHTDEPIIPDTAIARHAIEQYLSMLLTFESGGKGQNAPATEMRRFETEHQASIVLDVKSGEQTIPFKLYGFIDRKDEAVLADGRRCLRIIDYKTGKRSKRDEVKDLDAFFADIPNYPDNALQTLIYSLMYVHEGLPVVPMLYYVPSMSAPDFTPFITINKEPLTDFRDIANEFRDKLSQKLSELIDPAKPFQPTAVSDHCKYCDFKSLCGR